MTENKKPAMMTASDAWVMGVLMPMLRLFDLPSTELVDGAGPFLHEAYLNIVELETREEVLADTAFRVYRGERSVIRQLQATDGSVTQTDALVYDLVTAMLNVRSAMNAGLIEGDEGRRALHFLGRQLQHQFATWKDFIIAFAAVYALTRAMVEQDDDETASDLASFNETANLMLEANGLWQLVPWKLGLPVEGDADIELVRRESLTSVIFYRNEAVIGDPVFAPSPRHWCLAVAAIYRCWWGEPIDTLEPAPMLPFILERDWGVTDADSAEETLNGLFVDQHVSRLAKLQRTDPTLPQQNPLAWDLVRLMQVATSAVCAGYATEASVLPMMIKAGERLQDAYQSWDDLIDAFRAGRYLWQRLNHIDPDESAEADDDLDEVLELLVTDPRSPMLRIPWAIPLA
jgi:Protein of unknown function (DUF1266)